MLYTWGMTDDVAIPAADYDSPWKEALAQFLPDALALFFPAIHAQIDWDRGYILSKLPTMPTSAAAWPTCSCRYGVATEPKYGC